MRVTGTGKDRPHESTKAAKRASRKGKAREENAPLSTSAASRVEAGLAEDQATKPWSWSSLADVHLSRQQPVFTKDGRYFLVPVASTVKIYSTLTGKVVSTLKSHSRVANGHSDRITCLKINPNNPFQLYTGSSDGALRSWDFVNGVLLATIDVGYPINYISAHQDIEDHVFVACKKSSKKQSRETKTENYVIMRVSLKSSNPSTPTTIRKPIEIIVAGKVPVVIGMGISASGKWLVVAGGTKVYVASTPRLKAGFTKFVCPEKLSCLALHPSEDWLATGDENGQLRLWYCLSDDVLSEGSSETRSAPTTTLHWHAHAVQAIEFTPNGAYILSGGEENVLVIWQVHSGKKEFVPRVGAPIHTISVCDTGDGTREQEYLLGLVDGSLAFVRSSTLKLSRTISRVKLEPAHLRPSFAPPLVVHPQSACLILPSSHPSSLQIYSPSASALLSELEVSPSNRVSRPYEKPLEPSRVDHVAISGCGKWLATVDTRDGSSEGFGLEVYLKLWRWVESENRWDLNSKVDRPHGRHRVHSLTFSPRTQEEVDIILASAGGDAQVKTWCMKVQVDKKAEATVSWTMRSSSTYREQIPTQVMWSPDGSVLAVCQGSSVTLWSVKTNALYKVLNWAEIHKIYWVTFADRNGRYLVCAGLHSVVLYDLIRAQTLYMYTTSLVIRGLLSWRGKDHFALIQDLPSTSTSSSAPSFTTTITTLGVSSNRPIEQRTLPFLLRQYVTWSYSRSIIAITCDGGLIHAGENASRPGEESSEAKPLGSVAEEPSLFQDIFGKSALVDHLLPNQPPKSSISNNKSTESGVDWALLDAPSHLLPPVHTLFVPLMESMSRWNGNARDEAVDAYEQEKDAQDEMAIEPSGTASSTRTTREITAEEIDAFTDFFRDAAFTTARSSTAYLPSPIRVSPTGTYQGLTNGRPKMNGVHLTNGILFPIVPSTKPMTNGVSSHKPNKSILPPIPSSPTIGKKRKKAMMS